MRHIFLAGLLALGLMAAALAISKLLSLGIAAIIVLFPGMLLAEGLILVLPNQVNDALISYIGDGRVAFASMSVVFAFLFWWACMLMVIKIRAHWMKPAMP